MLGNAIASFVFSLLALLELFVMSVVQLVVGLLGPGLTMTLIGAIFALWWFGWI